MIPLNSYAPTNFCTPRSTHVNPSLHLPLAILFVCLASTHAALADEAINATVGQLGLACKNRVVEQFDVLNSDIGVRLGATLQQDIDAGAMTAKDLKARGASFGWGWPARAPRVTATSMARGRSPSSSSGDPMAFAQLAPRVRDRHRRFAARRFAGRGSDPFLLGKVTAAHDASTTALLDYYLKRR